MAEPLEPTEPVDPAEAILGQLDFAYSDDAARAAVLREGGTDPLIMGFLHKLASGEIDETTPGVIVRRLGHVEPGTSDTPPGERFKEFMARRVARRLAEEQRLIQSVDDQNPDNWLS